MSVCHVCAWCPGRSEKVISPLKLELQVLVRYHVDAKTQTQFSARAVSAHNS